MNIHRIHNIHMICIKSGGEGWLCSRASRPTVRLGDVGEPRVLHLAGVGVFGLRPARSLALAWVAQTHTRVGVHTCTRMDTHTHTHTNICVCVHTRTCTPMDTWERAAWLDRYINVCVWVLGHSHECCEHEGTVLCVCTCERASCMCVRACVRVCV
jgi:hypothetical protein